MAEIILNGVQLNPNLQWTDRCVSSGVRQDLRFSLGGRPLLSSGPMIGNRPVTLVSEEDSGWLSKDMADALIAMADTPGATYPFTYGTEIVNGLVVFRHHEQPALALRPLFPRVIPDSGDYWIGTIKLLLLS